MGAESGRGSRTAATAVLAVASAGWWLLAAPADAVQTTTFSLAPTGERTSIVLDAGQGQVTDHFVLTNLTHHPITIDLAVRTLRHVGTSYLPQPTATGFAAGVRLPTAAVRLAGGASRTLPVVIDTDGQSPGDQYAVIEAHQRVRPQSGVTTVAQLGLVVELKSAAPGAPTATGKDVAIGVAAALAAVLAGLLLAAVRRRRRG